MLRGAVRLDQPDVEIELALRDRRAVIHRDGQRIACALRMLHQRAQDGRGRETAEPGGKGEIVRAGAPLPSAVTGGDARGLIEQVWEFGKHEFSKFSSLRANGSARSAAR